MADSFGLKLGIEGEKSFKKSLKEINDTMKVLGSEMLLVSSKFDKQDKSVQALNARNSVLNKEIAEQRSKIELLQQALSNASASFGEADSRTKAWQEKLNKAQAELNGMEKELGENNKALKTAAEEFDDAEKESKQFGNEVKDSGEKAEKSGHKLQTLGKVAAGLGAAFTAAFAAMGVAVKKVVGEIGECVDVYANFDDSMRQVAATMGMSSEDIAESGGDFDKLAQAAKDAGASTRYAASDAADALNYLALAGYDTNQAIETMPKVLTLAAAGGMDLAYASDMITDSMSALGMKTSDLDMYMDQMAKTSQKSNTSVQQLGEAILVCGGTASLTGQDLDTVNTALGVMADNGIKGSEGGTKLRNVLLSLSSPTKNGAAELENLGVKIYDAKGNMRQLDDIMGDLNTSLSKLSQEDKTAAVSKIFSKRDIAAVNALLESTNGRFAELDALIKDSAGAAEEMANTMESGLAGTERSWASALEGLQIETGEIFAGLKQTALTEMTGIVRELTQGLSEAGGDWDKIGESVGAAIESILSTVGSYLPTIVNMAVGIISALVTGLTENIDQVVSVASEIISTLIGGMNTMLPQLITVAVPLLLALVNGILENLPMLVSAGLEMIVTLASGIAEALPTLIPQVVQVVVTLVTTLIENIPMLIEAALQIVVALAEGIGAALPELVKAIPQILAAIVTAINASLPQLLPAAIDIIFALIEGLLGALPELIAAVPNLILGIVQGILDNLPTIILYAPEIITSLITGLIGAIPQLIMAIPKIILSIVDTFKAYDWKSVGTNIMSGLRDGVHDMIGKIKDKFKDVVEAIKDTFKRLFGINSPSTVFAGFGGNLIQGLWNGISDAVTWLLDRVRGFGNQLIDTVKSVFGISSPSKVFADEIGKNLGLGIGIGFEDAMRDVSKDMADAIPTDFDVSANVRGTPEVMPGSGSGISLTLNIENFHNYRAEDINELADELSVILASKMNRKAAAF